MNKIIFGYALEKLKQLPDNSVDCIVTSPPYYQKRDYNTSQTFSDGYVGQLGLEPDFGQYIRHLLEIFEEAKRVLKAQGTCFVNIGDTYYNGKNQVEKAHSKTKNIDKVAKSAQKLPKGTLMQIPARFACAMVDNGWILRNEIVWAKPNGLPESVKNRFATKTERIYFFVKQQDYYFDLDAIRDLHAESTIKRMQNKLSSHPFQKNLEKAKLNPKGKNPSDVGDFWKIPNKTNHDKGTHSATYNSEIITYPILAGCPKGGVVLDMFAGTGTTILTAQKLGRKYIGIEPNKEYFEVLKKNVQGLGSVETKDNTIEILFGENPKKISENVLQVLRKAKITEKELLLDFEIPRKIYDEVKVIFENIGGKWKKGKGKNADGSPKGTIVFENYNPKYVFEYVLKTGFEPKKNPTDFFPTPKKLVEEMLKFVGINNCFDRNGTKVLEPSAGTGGIADVVAEQCPDFEIDCVEYLSVNAKLLRDKGYDVIQTDFLTWETTKKYDYVVMNPPFLKTGYIDHIYKAYELLSTPGDLVAIVPNTLKLTDKKSKEFWEFVACNGVFSVLGHGRFKEQGTNVDTIMVRLEKNYYPKKNRDSFKEYPTFDIWHFLAIVDNNYPMPEKRDEMFLEVSNLFEKRKYAEIDKVIAEFVEDVIYIQKNKEIVFCLSEDDKVYILNEYKTQILPENYKIQTLISQLKNLITQLK